MKRYLYALRYLISIHVLGLILFTAFRLILFLQGYEYLMDEEISVFTRLEAFVRGLWLDNVVACYISILPLVIVSICSLIGYFGKNLYRGIHIFFSVFYVVAFAISAADIPYFAYFFKHINASIFNWFGYTGTTLGLMFGEFSYIVAFVLFLCLSFLFVFLSRILLHRTCRDIQRVSAEKFHWKPELLTLLCSTLLIGVCLFGIRGRMGYNPIKVSAAYYCNNTFLNQLGISPSFNLLRSSLEASKSENREIDLMDEKEAISTVRRELNITDSLPDISPIARKIDNPGQPSRKNVVLVFMESMSAELLGHFGNPEHLTPFLDSIAVRSLCFNRFFSAGTHTNHAIHSVLYSYPALMKRNSMKGAVIPFFAGLPTILQDYTFVLSALVLLSVQCNPKPQESDEQIGNDSIIEYAELLSITYHDDYTDVKISNPWDSTRLLHRYILVPKTQNVPSNLPQGTVVRTPLSNTLVYASVHCSLLEQLDALSQIGGVCDLSYIKTPALLSRAENGKLTDAGNSMSPDIERVMSLNPDAILLSPFENAGYGRIGKMGIPIIECADYLETSPLGRAEWIKFFGLLYGKEVEADSIFTEVEKNYTELRDKIGVLSSAPVVISELKSGSAWYMPGGKSYMARFFKDAGAAYPWSDNTETGSIPLSFETVFNRAGEADIWLIKSFHVSELSYRTLQKEYAPYARFKAFREKKIYGCDSSRCNYYEETPFRPDLLLQELAALFHPGLFPDYRFRYYQPLSE